MPEQQNNYLSGTEISNHFQPVQLSFGEKLVGITFNPSNDDKVAKVKSLFAEIANIVDEERTQSFQGGTYTALRELLTEHSITEILNAQMNTVKVLTLKY